MSDADSPHRDLPYVLDSHAVMAYARDEPGSDRTEELLQASARGERELHMSLLNVTEVFYVLWRRQGPVAARAAVDRLSEFGVRIHSPLLEDCLEAGALKAQHPISLGDAFAAALARKLDATLLTGDPEFKRLKDLVRIEWLK